MAVGRITKRSVEAIPEPVGPARAYLWDDVLKGFGVMVTAAGSRSYLVQFQIGGRGAPTRRATIGRHGSPWTADRARDRAADLLELVRKGVDPVEDAKRQRNSDSERKLAAERLAFDGYVTLFGTRYLEKGGRRGKGKPLRSSDDVLSMLRREWVSVFKARPLSSIRKQEVRDRLDEIADRSMSAAIKAHKWLRALFAWAVERGDIGASPMQDMPSPGADGERDRWLKEPWELRAVWNASGDLGEPYASFVKALILTGQRLREVAGMQWSELDLGASRWVVPAMRTKNKRDHLLPLSPPMVELLSARFPDEASRTGPVFTTDGKKPINGFSKPKAKLDVAVSSALARLDLGVLPIMQPWVFHDLRRTFSTGSQSLGFPRDHIHAALNHAADGKRAGLARVYQLYEYEPEKVAVMSAWARHVAAVVNGGADNVVSLATKRG